MISSPELLELLIANGVDLISGVPCSTLGNLISLAAESSFLRYVPAANEGDAVAIAAGAWLAGGSGCAVMQNSGLGNAVSPLTSLLHPFAIPARLCIGWRGKPGSTDEPQHVLMGGITRKVLELCGVETVLLSSISDHCVSDRLLAATLAILVDSPLAGESRLEPLASCRSYPASIDDVREGGLRPLRRSILQELLATNSGDEAILSTTGRCSRELFDIEDRPEHFYQVGSMGCVSSIGLGFALRNEASTIVIDGDGAALMRLGAMATIGAMSPNNLVHLLIDNEQHETTGGQPTVSNIVDLSRVASASGYATAGICDSVDGFRILLNKTLAAAGPHFIVVKVKPGTSPTLGRPTLLPRDVARRFRERFSGTRRSDPRQ